GLGYSRRSIVLGFMLEGTFVAAMGGLLGALLSLAAYTYVVVGNIQFGTMDFQSFAETVFQFRVTPELMLIGFVFSLVIGLVGSFLPALRASRLAIIAALRSVWLELVMLFCVRGRCGEHLFPS